MLATLLPLLAGCTSPEAPPAAEVPPRPSLVLVTLDTTRADRIGAYGYAEAHTPNLDKLAAEGARFDRAYATVPLTTPAHSSMMTGLYPTRHGVRTNGDSTLPAELQTLAESLQAAGYRTGASVSAFVTTRMWGLDQGFDAYFDTLPASRNPENRWGQERPADQVVDDALRWVQQGGDTPFFLWVHLYDAHAPYAPPAEWAAKLPGRPYDGELAFVDQQVGRLRAAVEAASPGGVAWIAVADHGEGLSEKDHEISHGLYLYEATTRIPFIVRPARGSASGVVVKDVAVSNVDVMPTALGLLGIPVPQGLDGVDLSAAAAGGAFQRSPVYLEAITASQRFGYHPEIAVVEGNLKLMNTPSARLFDVLADPGELTNLLAQSSEAAQRLKQACEAVIAATVARQPAAGMPVEVMEQLAALGYIGASGASDPRFDSTVDAKDQGATIQALERARGLARDPATLAEAEAIYREILKKEPQLGEARLALATLLERRGKANEAIEVLRGALAHAADSTVLRMNLAALLARQKRLEEALVESEAALALVPTDPQARAGVLRILMALKRPDDALKRGEAWLLEPGAQPGVQAITGVLLFRQKEYDRARTLLEASLAGGTAPQPRVHELLARLATMRGEIPAMAEHLHAELASFPENHTARWALGNYQMSLKAWDEAAAELRYIAESKSAGPHAVTSRILWAQAVFNTGDYALASEILAPARAAAPKNAQGMMLEANLLAKAGEREKGAELAKEAQALFVEQRGGRAAGPANPFDAAPEADDAADAGRVAPAMLPPTR